MSALEKKFFVNQISRLAASMNVGVQNVEYHWHGPCSEVCVVRFLDGTRTKVDVSRMELRDTLSAVLNDIDHHAMDSLVADAGLRLKAGCGS